MNETIKIALAVLLPIAAFILLILLRARRQRLKRQTELERLIDDTVREEGLVLSRQEWVSGKMLALDAGQQLLLFARYEEQPTVQVIHLADVRECRLKYSGSVIREQKKGGVQVSEEHVTEVSLSLTHRDHVITDLPLYNEIRDGLPEKMPLLELGERWLELIRQHMAEASVHSLPGTTALYSS